MATETKSETEAKTPPKSKKLSELSPDELKSLLGLVSSSDSVELKVTLPAAAQQGTVAALGLDPLDAQIRQIFFLDTPELTLNKAGVVARARRIQGRSGDSVVKLRPVVPDELAPDVRNSPNLNVEVDMMPGGYVCSASMKGKIDNAEVRRAIQGKRPLRKVFSKEQRAFFTAHAPEGSSLDDLRILGPIFVLKLVTEPPELKRRLVAELWLLPDGSRIVELSTKCPPRDAFQTALEARAYLEGLGLDLEPDPHTKTKTALDYFAAKLAAES